MSGGGKSSTSTTQATTQQEGGSLVSGVQLQAGGSITYSPQVTPETVDIFKMLINATQESLQLASGAGQLAVQAVQSNTERLAQPGESLTRDLMPIALLATAGIIVYVVFGRK